MDEMLNQSETPMDLGAMALKQKTLNIQNFLPEIHLGVLQAFDHPSDILAYITACPNAAQVWWKSKGTVLRVWINKTLNPTAIWTGIKILKCVDTAHSLTFRQLGQLGSQASTDTKDMSVEMLEGLFKLCCYHELFVRRCMAHTWLEKRLYMYDFPYREWPKQLYNGRMQYFWPSMSSDLLCRLERPARGGVPLHARLYSGFFSLELFMRLGGLHQGGINDTWLHPREWIDLYDVPYTRYGLHFWLWSDVDLAVDMNIVDTYLACLDIFADRRRTEPVPEAVSGEEIRKILRLERCSTLHLSQLPGDKYRGGDGLM